MYYCMLIIYILGVFIGHKSHTFIIGLNGIKCNFRVNCLLRNAKIIYYGVCLCGTIGIWEFPPIKIQLSNQYHCLTNLSQKCCEHLYETYLTIYTFYA